LLSQQQEVIYHSNPSAGHTHTRQHAVTAVAARRRQEPQKDLLSRERKLLWHLHSLVADLKPDGDDLAILAEVSASCVFSQLIVSLD
jgi:hypothetical protein